LNKRACLTDCVVEVAGPVRDEALRLRLANRLDALEPARQAVETFLAPAGLSPKVIYKLELVLEETFMNLLWHAFKDGAEHTIELAVRLQPGEVVLHFEDDGIAFDPTLAAEPARPASIDDAPVGGRGLALVRRAAKHIAYRRSAEHNHLTIAVATE
jgi:serine/threonine-protein kinase RsbW